MAYTRKVKFSSTGNYGSTLGFEDDVYTVEEFRRFSKGAFNDNDGFGYPVKDKLADSSISVYPSRLDLIPEDATHIIWFNK